MGIASGHAYRSTNFHSAVDFERVGSTPAGEATFTWQNTKLAGEQLRILFENVTPLRAANPADWDWTRTPCSSSATTTKCASFGSRAW